MFYSESTGGFYSAEIHGNTVPVDVVEITEDQHVALLNAQSSGKVIVADANGFPVAIDPVPIEANIATQTRAQRDGLLYKADIAINIAEDAGQDTTALRKYRQALRDIPEQKGFPDKVDWPTI